MTFDDLRASRPELGFAVYAYEPGGEVLLEIHAPEGLLFRFTGKSLQDAVDAAFPQQEMAGVLA
jgi:hypothetical protein